ncbi:hypothetical protein STA3757_32980 [Stanieria sp. NIES-3757]|nr:hypothetical protein STA3757_32980 [Stanieria sp. NIES-3757]
MFELVGKIYKFYLSKVQLLFSITILFGLKIMNKISDSRNQKKVVAAPPPTNSEIIPSIYSIEINLDEEVEWQWLKLPDGNRVVIDYKIICREKLQS